MERSSGATQNEPPLSPTGPDKRASSARAKTAVCRFLEEQDADGESDAGNKSPVAEMGCLGSDSRVGFGEGVEALGMPARWPGSTGAVTARAEPFSPTGGQSAARASLTEGDAKKYPVDSAQAEPQNPPGCENCRKKDMVTDPC